MPYYKSLVRAVCIFHGNDEEKLQKVGLCKPVYTVNNCLKPNNFQTRWFENSLQLLASNTTVSVI
jgi:hypothetical protein